MRTLAATLAGMFVALALTACSRPVSPVATDDVSLGNDKAKVTVVEYASVACPVCAQWNNDNWAQFKKTYIDTGRVHYVLREALTHDPAIAAAGFALARCAGKDKYFTVVDTLYHQRDAIEASPAPMDNMRAIARANGLSDQQFQTCVSDAKTLAAINARWEKYGTEDKIASTPTFIVNGQRVEGALPLSQLGDMIAAAEKGS